MKITWKAARINADLALVDSAKSIGVTKNTLSSYENYRTIPDIVTANKMAALYKVSLDNIIICKEVVL